MTHTESNGDEIGGTPPRLAALGVEWAPEQFAGMPWYAAWILRAQSPDDSLFDLLLPTDQPGTPSCFGLRVRRLARSGGPRAIPAADDTDVVVDVPPAPRLDEHAFAPRFDLDFGEVRRGLVDLSRLLDRSLPPDTYSVEVAYVGGVEASHCTASPPADVRFVPLPPEMLAYVANMRAALEATGSWERACEHLVERGQTTPLPGNHPLAYPMLLALSRSPADQFARLPPGAFAGFGSPLAPHVAVLYVEWLLARGEVERAREEARSLLTTHAGLTHDIRALAIELPELG